jgi:glycogen(starch) synthase
VVASESARERLERMGVEPAVIALSVQSADVARFARLRGSRPSGGPVRVASIGRLVPDKNVASLIRAFALANIGSEEGEIVVWGEGPLLGELRELARGLGAPVRFEGFVAPAELERVYSEADVVALPSRFEPFGVTMREGAAAGRALLCSRTAGAAGTVAIEGRNALLVDPEDLGALTRAVESLVRDRELRERLAAESARVSDERPLERDAGGFEEAVLSAVER